MAKSEAEQHQACTEKLIELANTLANEGVSKNIVSQALMHASGVYATFVAAGNQGGLNESGVEKIADLYKRNLSTIQQTKREQLGVTKS